VTCKYRHNHKDCFTFIIKDKHLANYDNEPLILERSYKGRGPEEIGVVIRNK